MLNSMSGVELTIDTFAMMNGFSPQHGYANNKISRPICSLNGIFLRAFSSGIAR